MLNNAYVQAARAKNRERSKRYYDNQIKNDPEKYKKILRKMLKKKIIIILKIRINTYVCIEEGREKWRGREAARGRERMFLRGGSAYRHK